MSYKRIGPSKQIGLVKIGLMKVRQGTPTAGPETGRLPGAGSNVPEAMSEKALQTQR